LFVISTFRRATGPEDFSWAAGACPRSSRLSFVATEISALTIGHAAWYFRELALMQFLVGFARRVDVAFLFIPAFYKYQCTSIYEFLGHRFGPATQYTGSIYFLITRLLASGVRLYATCMAVGKIMDWPLAATIALFTVVSILSFAQWIKAVVWRCVRGPSLSCRGARGRLPAGLSGRHGTALRRLSRPAEHVLLRLGLRDSTFWAGIAGASLTSSPFADQEWCGAPRQDRRSS
jgi:hypothetical protein